MLLCWALTVNTYMCVCLFFFNAFSRPFYLFSLLFFPCWYKRDTREVGYFFSDEAWGWLGAEGMGLRSLVGAAICRFLYELTSQRIWNFSIFTVDVVAVVVNVCNSHAHTHLDTFLGGAKASACTPFPLPPSNPCRPHLSPLFPRPLESRLFSCLCKHFQHVSLLYTTSGGR